MSGSSQLPSPSPSPLSKWIVPSLSGDDDDESEEENDHEREENTASSSSAAVLPLTQPTHLFLHFDINETILLGDDAGGDSCHASMHKMLAKSSFCRMPASETENNDHDSNEHDDRRRWEQTTTLVPTHWWDGQEMNGQEQSVPKLYTGWRWPTNCCPYYRTAYKKQATSFVEQHPIYGPVFEACEAAIASHGTKRHNQKPTIILPAFYETLHHLITTSSTDDSRNSNSKKLPFTIIFRTFGSDLADMASVVTTFAKGEHPKYPEVHVPSLCLSKDRLYQGRWKTLRDEDDPDHATTCRPRRRSIYQLWQYHDDSQLVASGDAEILELLNEGAIFGIRDDYDFWKKNQWHPMGGKPIWVRHYNDDTIFNGNNSNEEDTSSIDHHLLFDDNIHNLHQEGIACVRQEVPVGNTDDDNNAAMIFETIEGANIDVYQGMHLVRVPTIEPILNPRWYIQQIDRARKRFQRHFHPRHHQSSFPHSSNNKPNKK